MKKIVILMLFISFSAVAQFNESAPWVKKETIQAGKYKEKNITTLVNEFSSYWLTNDKNKKGSGYKPFMRWENHWRNKTNANGFLLTPNEMWTAWQQKNQAEMQKGVASLPTSNWQPLGPYTYTNTTSWSPGQGRVNIVVEDPNTPTTLYIGTPAGGIWKSVDNGTNWQALADKLPQIGVSGIAIDYTNSNTIYIATGDKDAGDSYSIGVMKSTDGGTTWATTGLSFANTYSRAGDISMHPTNNQILLCATSNGLYRTTDAGTTWQVVQSGSFAQGTIRFKPNDPTTVYATTYNSFYRSTDGGATFSQISFGLPTDASRMIIDVTPANNNYIYMLTATATYEFQGVYKSTDGGTSWNKTNFSGDLFDGSTQSWFDLALAVSDTNENEIYTGTLNIWKSTNGGDVFTKLNNWNTPSSPSYTHADIHYLGFYNGRLFAGTDGGIYVSSNNGNLFTDLTATAQIGQFYRISVAKQSVSNIAGGLQDNGGYALSNGTWKSFYGADGMDTAIHPNNPNIYYGFIQNGSSLYITTTAGNGITNTVAAPSGEAGNWVTPLKINSSGELYAGYKELYTLNQTPAWVQKNTTSLGSGKIRNIAIAPSNDAIVFWTKFNNLYKSTDGGTSYSIITTTTNDIVAITVHNTNPDIVYVVTQGTGGKVLQSTDGGVTFSDISSGLPMIGKNVIKHQDRSTDNALYLGTSLGVYYKDDSMTTWQPFSTNLPNVSVTDLEINLEDKKLVASTYGRGVWLTDIPVENLAVDAKLKELRPIANQLITCNSVTNLEVDIENKGTNAITNLSIDYTITSTASTNTQNYVWNGNLNSNEITTINLPISITEIGAYEITATVTTSSDGNLYNNTATTFIYQNENGIINSVNSFTDAADALLTYSDSGITPEWIRGIRTTGALAEVGNTVYTTNETGNYDNNIKMYLVSNCYDLSVVSNPEISFSMRYDLEENWDILYVEYSTDLGANWQVLGTKTFGWYNSDRTPTTTGSDCYNCVGAQWTGTSTSPATYSYPLTTLNSETNVIFRFVFQSDQAVNKEGITIDNFVINGTLSTTQFSEEKEIEIYPNPSHGNFIITFENIEPTTISVYDMAGKEVWKTKNITMQNKTTTINLNNIANGIYFVKITTANQTIIKRIIKE